MLLLDSKGMGKDGMRCCLAFCMAASVWGLLGIGSLRAADPVVYRDFDGPATTWKLTARDGAARLLSHANTADEARQGSGSERLILAAPAGESAHLVCPTERLPVLDELEARLWVKASRPAVRLAIRVVLPRSLDPETGQPATTLVMGNSYDQLGSWQQLVLHNVPRLLADQVRVMRAKPGASIDPGEAYVDAIVLVVPGEPGGTTVWTDELRVDGILVDSPADSRSSSQATAPNKIAADRAVVQTGWRNDLGPSVSSESRTIRLQGVTLMVDGKPFLPRAIEWNGEPLEFLAQRGFNAILLNEMPSHELAAEAHQREMWILCSPPRPEALLRDGLSATSDRVLAWFLGTHVATPELDYVRRWSELVRQYDPDSGRPIVIAPEIDLLPLSKTADVLMVRHPQGSRVTGAEFARWLEERPRLARPGTPLWIRLDTQWSESTSRQAAMLSGEQSLSAGLDDGQLFELIRATSTRGIRGFVFQSNSQLNLPDAVTQRRAAVLELVNRQLELLEPWLATGKVLGSATSTDGASSAVLMQVERARLLVPLTPLENQVPPAAKPTAASKPIGKTFVVPGVPESNRASLLSMGGLRPLTGKRIAGGMSVALEPEDDGFVLLTEDAKVESALRTRLARTGPETVRLQKELAMGRAAAVMATSRRLEQLGYPSAGDEEPIQRASTQVGRCEALLKSGQVEPAYQAVCHARRILDDVAERHRERVIHGDDLISSPLDTCYDTLSQGAALLKSLDSLRTPENLLPGGDFEDLSQLMGLGWRHVTHASPAVETRAELSSTKPYHGRYCLQLSTSAKGDGRAALIQPDAPVWITSPPMPALGGQLIEISGWVRVPEAIGGSGQGLQIVDSIGGPELALSVRETGDWRPFRMLRAVPDTNQVTLTIALDGLGTAWVDAVMVRPLGKADLRRLPSLPADPSDTAQHPGPALYPSTGR